MTGIDHKIERAKSDIKLYRAGWDRVFKGEKCPFKPEVNCKDMQCEECEIKAEALEWQKKNIRVN